MEYLTEEIAYSKAELFFPARLIPTLRDLRGEKWRQLVDQVSRLPDTHPDTLAFVLMMIKLGPCMKCHSNNFRFLRGCAVCSHQSIQSFKGTDTDLVNLYYEARHEIDQYLHHGVVSLSLAA
jgi:hypothetical protein